MIKMTIAQFVNVLPQWHAKYGDWQQGLRELTEKLEKTIPLKSNNLGYLDMNDLVDIAEWGGNQYDRKGKLQANNTNGDIRKKTREAIQYLNKDNWYSALQSLNEIHSWGLAYSTKTLRFIRPQDYPAFDSLLRSGIKVLSLKRTAASYGQFITLCSQIRKGAPASGPRSDHSWWLADVEMALFAFVRDGNELI